MEAAALEPRVHPGTATLGAEAREILKLGWPLALAQAGQALFGLVDTAVVGRVGAQAQGAVGLGNALFIGISVLGMGVMMALDPLISQAIGAQDRARARGLYWQGVWLAAIASAVLVVPIALAPQALKLAGIDPALVGPTERYVVWRLPQLPMMLLFIVARAWLQSVGRTVMLFVATAVANVVNLLLCAWLVLTLRWGVEGAAVATVVSAALQLGIVLAVLGAAPSGTRRGFDAAAARKTTRVGLPIGLQMFAEVGVFTAAGVIASSMNEQSIAAHQIAITWASFTFCLAVGTGAAGAVRVGWAIGARDTRAARRAGFAAIGMGVVIMSSSAVLFFTVPTVFAHLMTDRPDVLAVVVGLFGVTAVFQVFDGIQAVAAGALRGAGDTAFPFWANLVGHWGVGLPISLWLGLRLQLGVVGLWWGLCAGLVAVGVSLLLRFAWLTRRDVAAL